MDHCHTSELISLQQALEKLLTQITPLTDTETVGLSQTSGRITATNIISPINVPPFANSAMDGYAVRYVDLMVINPYLWQEKRWQAHLFKENGRLQLVFAL